MTLTVAECPASPNREELVSAVLERVDLIGSTNRTLFSSTDETIVDLIKSERPDVYSALSSDAVETAVSLEQDAIQPDVTVSAATVQAALDAGLQVNVRDANTAEEMMQQIENGVSAIITDEPGILADLEAPAP